MRSNVLPSITQVESVDPRWWVWTGEFLKFLMVLHRCHKPTVFKGASESVGNFALKTIDNLHMILIAADCPREWFVFDSINCHF